MKTVKIIYSIAMRAGEANYFKEVQGEPCLKGFAVRKIHRRKWVIDHISTGFLVLHDRSKCRAIERLSMLIAEKGDAEMKKVYRRARQILKNHYQIKSPARATGQT